jgi:hypothetical protein
MLTPAADPHLIEVAAVYNPLNEVEPLVDSPMNNSRPGPGRFTRTLNPSGRFCWNGEFGSFKDNDEYFQRTRAV